MNNNYENNDFWENEIITNKDKFYYILSYIPVLNIYLYFSDINKSKKLSKYLNQWILFFTIYILFSILFMVIWFPVLITTIIYILVIINFSKKSYDGNFIDLKEIFVSIKNSKK